MIRFCSGFLGKKKDNNMKYLKKFESYFNIKIKNNQLIKGERYIAKEKDDGSEYDGWYAGTLSEINNENYDDIDIVLTHEKDIKKCINNFDFDFFPTDYYNFYRYYYIPDNVAIDLFKENGFDIAEKNNDEIVAVSIDAEDEHRFILDKNSNLIYVKNASEEKDFGRVNFDMLELIITTILN